MSESIVLAPDITVSTSTNSSTLYIMVLQVCVQGREFIGNNNNYYYY